VATKADELLNGLSSAEQKIFSATRGDKPGYQYQFESVFAARQIGWDHLGCVFSTIEDNYIYKIALKREFYGYEIAGIKLTPRSTSRSGTIGSTTAHSGHGSTGRHRARASPGS
jgi:hypothetical protein